jgi:membrane protein DedA with SNARE-associated domain
MSGLLAHALSLVHSSQYALLFFGSVLEGTVAMLVGGYLVHEGTARVVPAYLSLFAGNVVIDLCWYALGRFGGRAFILKFGRLFNATEETLTKAESLFARHHTWILIVTKLTSGFGFAVAILTTAGMLRVPLKRYMFINIASGFIWIAMVMAVGYAFGNVLSLVPGIVQLIFLCIVVLAFIFGVRRMNKKLAAGEW